MTGKYPRFFLFILLVVVPCHAALQATEKPDLDKIRITLEVNEMPLREALRELVAQSKLQIVYNDALVNEIKVNCSCKNATLRQALEELLRTTQLAFEVMNDGQIVIVEAGPDKKVNLKGFVKDAETGETLPYANLALKGTHYGTASNVNGYFVLVNVPAGPCTLRVSYIGYASLDLPITATDGKETIMVKMKPQALQSAEVIVTTENLQMLEISDAPAQIRISPQQMANLPSVGEVDIFRSLQLLPGISGVNDGSSSLYIRGGTPEQNHVLFDGMTIYHVDHFFGFISAFNTEAIKDVRVFKGGFPAKFGGRTSSVVELTGKSGSYDKFQAGGSLNLLSGSGIVQLPIAGRGAWLFSLRRSYTDFVKTDLYNKLYSSITGQNQSGGSGHPNSSLRIGPGQRIGAQAIFFTPDFYYYDLNSKLSYSLSARDVLSLSFYNGRDNLDQSQNLGNQTLYRGNAVGGPAITNMATGKITMWGNTGASGKWARVWSDRFYSNFLAAYSIYSSENRSRPNNGAESQNPLARTFSSSEKNDVEDLTIRFDNEWQVHKAHKVEFGSWLSRTNARVRFTANDTIEVLRRNDEAVQNAFYLQDTWNAFKPLELTLGVRATNYEPTKTTYFEPRTSFKFSLHENFWLKGAWGEYHQFVNRVTNENVLQGNRDFWLLADEKLAPSFAEHKILGLTYENYHLLFDVEAYHKDLEGVAEFSPHFHRSPEARPEEPFFLGTGVAEGIEFLAQKKSGKLNGWASYTLSKVEYQFPAFNNGEAFPADQDRRHEVKLVGNYAFGKWNLAATWVFASGAPYTAPESQYAIKLLDGGMHSYIHVGDKNANRLPAYHRMDVSLSRKFSSTLLDWNFGISIFNLYDRKNVWRREYILNTHPVIVRDVTSLGFAPTVMMKVNWK
jgi:hypothetical protein